MIPETENHRRPKEYVRFCLRGMRKLIRVDTLRRVTNVGFLVEQLIYNINHALENQHQGSA